MSPRIAPESEAIRALALRLDEEWFAETGERVRVRPGLPGELRQLGDSWVRVLWLTHGLHSRRAVPAPVDFKVRMTGRCDWRVSR